MEFLPSYLESNDILAIDLANVVISEKAIAGSRTILHQRSDTARLKDEANMARAVLMHGDCALERPVRKNTKTNVIQKCKTVRIGRSLHQHQA